MRILLKIFLLILILTTIMTVVHLSHIRSLADAGKEPGSPAKDIPETIESLRNKIDTIDQKILALLNERAEAAVEIGELKQEQGLSVYNPGREKVIEDKLKRDNPGPLPDSSVIKIYKEIIAACRAIQY